MRQTDDFVTHDTNVVIACDMSNLANVDNCTNIKWTQMLSIVWAGMCLHAVLLHKLYPTCYMIMDTSITYVVM